MRVRNGPHHLKYISDIFNATSLSTDMTVASFIKHRERTEPRSLIKTTNRWLCTMTTKTPYNVFPTLWRWDPVYWHPLGITSPGTSSTPPGSSSASKMCSPNRGGRARPEKSSIIWERERCGGFMKPLQRTSYTVKEKKITLPLLSNLK